VLVAQQCALLANVNRDPKKRARPYTSAEFMPRWERPKQQTPDQMKNVMKAFTLAFGGTVRKGSGSG
jgi:hypothetical protein